MKWIFGFVVVSFFLLIVCQFDDDFIFDDGIDINMFDNLNGGNLGVDQNEMEEFGCLLFWDLILLGELDVFCVICYYFDFGYVDGCVLFIGVGGQGLGLVWWDLMDDDIGLVGCNLLIILNMVFNGIWEDGSINVNFMFMFWDNWVNGLEE